MVIGEAVKAGVKWLWDLLRRSPDAALHARVLSLQEENAILKEQLRSKQDKEVLLLRFTLKGNAY